MVETLAPDEVDDVIAGSGERPAVLAAWAPACGACHQLNQILALAAEEFRGLDFYRLDVRDPAAAEAARRLGLRVAPTLLVFRGGVERHRLEVCWDAGAVWEVLTAAAGGGPEGV